MLTVTEALPGGRAQTPAKAGQTRAQLHEGPHEILTSSSVGGVPPARSCSKLASSFTLSLPVPSWSYFFMMFFILFSLDAAASVKSAFRTNASTFAPQSGWARKVQLAGPNLSSWAKNSLCRWAASARDADTSGLGPGKVELPPRRLLRMATMAAAIVIDGVKTVDVVSWDHRFIFNDEKWIPPTIANGRGTVAEEWKHHRCDRLKRRRDLSVEVSVLRGWDPKVPAGSPVSFPKRSNPAWRLVAPSSPCRINTKSKHQGTPSPRPRFPQRGYRIKPTFAIFSGLRPT